MFCIKKLNLELYRRVECWSTILRTRHPHSASIGISMWPFKSQCIQSILACSFWRKATVAEWYNACSALKDSNDFEATVHVSGRCRHGFESRPYLFFLATKSWSRLWLYVFYFLKSYRCIYASGAISIALWRLEHTTKIIMFLFEEIEPSEYINTDAVTSVSNIFKSFPN